MNINYMLLLLGAAVSLLYTMPSLAVEDAIPQQRDAGEIDRSHIQMSHSRLASLLEGIAILKSTAASIASEGENDYAIQLLIEKARKSISRPGSIASYIHNLSNNKRYKIHGHLGTYEIPGKDILEKIEDAKKNNQTCYVGLVRSSEYKSIPIHTVWEYCRSKSAVLRIEIYFTGNETKASSK